MSIKLSGPLGRAAQSGRVEAAVKRADLIDQRSISIHQKVRHCKLALRANRRNCLRDVWFPACEPVEQYRTTESDASATIGQRKKGVDLRLGRINARWTADAIYRTAFCDMLT